MRTAGCRGVAAHDAASIALLEKVGFIRFATERGYAAGVGRVIDEYVYALVPVADGNGPVGQNVFGRTIGVRGDHGTLPR